MYTHFPFMKIFVDNRYDNMTNSFSENYVKKLNSQKNPQKIGMLVKFTLKIDVIH